MALFENDIKISGKHKLYLQELKDTGVFPTYREIYTVCTAVGFLYGLKSPVDHSEDVKSSTIFASDLTRQKSNLKFLYRLIMLLDEKEEYDIEDYKNRAFRDDAIEDNEEKMKENMDIFNSYFRGGLEKIYDIFRGIDSNKEKVDALSDFLTEMCVDYGFIKEFE